MKFYNLHVAFSVPSWNTYNEISRILGLVPTEHTKSNFDQSDEPSDWHYQIIEKDEDPTIDFINVFLDILEPNFEKLAQLGIGRDAILFWLVYEYSKQCAMEFHPDEMQRLGQSGICLNIDCFENNQRKEEKQESKHH